MTNAIMIKGETAALVAAAEAEMDEFRERADKEYSMLHENFKDIVCTAFEIPKEDYAKYELVLTTKFYKQFGFMILEKQANMMHGFMESLEDAEEAKPKKHTIQ